jgi:sulfite oxidase
MLTRRQFVQTASALAAANYLVPRAGATQASPLIAGKSEALQMHTAEPLVLETPLELLDQHLLTPSDQLFVRNNTDAVGGATLDPPRPEPWDIEFVGLADGAKSIDVAELAKLPSHEVEMVLQCSGNGRSMFSRAAKTSGTQWGRGGIGNVRFAGPRLSDVLERFQIKPSAGVRFLCAEGRDAAPAGKDEFEHSVPLDDAMERGMLALSLNGEPLPAIHGGPVRLVLPGYYGTVQMKWLMRLRFETEESRSEHHGIRYRTPHRLLKPGEEFDFTLDNSSPTWKIQLASLITSHAENEQVPPGATTLAGYAWNDGAAPLTSVLLSTDRGETWRATTLERSKSPYAWSRWQANVEIAPGANHLWIAATDALGRSQPLDGNIRWNPPGYEWNGMERIVLQGVTA